MNGTVSDIMNPKVLYIREGDRIELARYRIIEFGITAVPVLDELHRPVGMVSLRDLARPDHATFDPSTKVAVVEASQKIEDAARVLAETPYHHVVVVDGAGVAVGMVSATDFVRALVGLPPRHPAKFEAY